MNLSLFFYGNDFVKSFLHWPKSDTIFFNFLKILIKISQIIFKYIPCRLSLLDYVC